ncbi:MAG: arginine--tRNA ligase [Patescibacteria group bacterium]
MKEELVSHIKIILEEFGIENPKVSLDIPTRTNMGDYSTSGAMAYAKKLDRKPLDLANEIKDILDSKHIPHVAKIEVVMPGFINFFFDADYYSQNVERILTQENKYGKNKTHAGEKIIVEYTVTNVLKPLHIGHLMGNVIGESLSNIIHATGAEVKRNNYQGDSGLHIAKTIWGMRKLGGKVEGSLHDKVEYIGKAYALGANTFETDEVVQKEIKDINKNIFEKTDLDAVDLYMWARQVSLDHFEELYAKLGTKFDYYFFESEVTEDALRIVHEFLKKGLFEESDGAIVFHGEKYDKSLHTRVFVNSQGIPMYEAKDIAHAFRKYKTYPFDKAIIITANEQDGYFKVVLEALRHIDAVLGNKIQHLSHGILKLTDGKMSSRKGNVITGESLIEDVENLVMEKVKDREWTDEKKSIVATMVGVAAIKYSILRQAVGGDIIFDFDKSLSFEGDSGPYLQYATVRANSLLEKADGVVKMSENLPAGWQTTNLERLLEQYPDVVLRAGELYAPHYIVTYLVELAGEFNSFYASHKIIDTEDKTSPYRLALTRAFVTVMISGLDLLGIKVPDSM